LGAEAAAAGGAFIGMMSAAHTSKPKAADLWRRPEGDLCAAAADAEGRRAQVPGRRDVEHGRIAGKRGRKES
jgi:hypothetical protein